MHKLVIFLTLIACVLATWTPTSKHESHPHQSIAAHQKGVEHVHHKGVEHAKRSAVPTAGHNVRTPHGQLESVHHGGDTLYRNKEFRRTKKGHHDKQRDAKATKNHLRRLRSEKHH